MKTCVILPAHNESATIAGIVEQIKKQNLHVLVIDDGSTDDSARLARTQGAVVLRTQRNYGKGAALTRGFSYALEHGFDAVITMDADGQHLPQDIPVFLESLRDPGPGLVIGNRMANLGAMPYLRVMTNRFMSWMLSMITGQKICDSQCGFRLISRTVLEKLKLDSRKFEIESEIIIEACRKGCTVVS
ncbi:MAG: glycosyltransferase family 2 protein, partial [Candidatus Omnitrophica bacterium]|nr:glycosyltransferase family 2 protein [Candidatus Omnitrophota bacterium]